MNVYQVSCFRKDRTGKNEVLAFDGWPMGGHISEKCDPEGPLRLLLDGFGFPEFDQNVLSIFRKIPETGGYLAVNVGDYIIAMVVIELHHV